MMTLHRRCIYVMCLPGMLSAWTNFASLAIQNEPSEEFVISVRTRRLIWIFTGRTYPKVRFLTFRAIWLQFHKRLFAWPQHDIQAIHKSAVSHIVAFRFSNTSHDQCPIVTIHAIHVIWISHTVTQKVLKYFTWPVSNSYHTCNTCDRSFTYRHFAVLKYFV